MEQSFYWWSSWICWHQSRQLKNFHTLHPRHHRHSTEERNQPRTLEKQRSGMCKTKKNYCKHTPNCFEGEAKCHQLIQKEWQQIWRTRQPSAITCWSRMLSWFRTTQIRAPQNWSTYEIKKAIACNSHKLKQKSTCEREEVLGIRHNYGSKRL